MDTAIGSVILYKKNKKLVLDGFMCCPFFVTNLNKM